MKNFLKINEKKSERFEIKPKLLTIPKFFQLNSQQIQ